MKKRLARCSDYFAVSGESSMPTQSHPGRPKGGAKKQQQAHLQGHSEQMAAIASAIAISLASESNDIELETLINLFSHITQILRLILAQRAVDGKFNLVETVIL